MVSWTSPWGLSFAFAYKSIVTNASITRRKTMILISMMVDCAARIVILSKLFFSLNYNLIPINDIKAIAISPVVINVIPSPFSGAGTFE